MDRIRQLKVFMAAIRHGSITAAGREIGLSPAMAGKYLRALESTLGVRLLHRTTRALSLTDAGQRYLSASKEILRALDDADTEARAGTRQLSGPVRLGVPRAYGQLKLAEMLVAFCRRYPEITLDLHTDERYADLVDDRLDLVVRIGRLADSALRVRRIGTVTMGVFGSPDLVDADGCEDLVRVRMLPRLAFAAARSPGDWVAYDDAMRAFAIDGKLVMRSDEIMLLVRAAVAGLGILYAPEFAVEGALAQGDLVRLLPNYRFAHLDLQIVYSDRRHQPVRVRALIDHLQENVQQRGRR